MGLGRRDQQPTDGIPTLDELVAALREKNASDPLEAASTVKLQLFRDADGDDPISGLIPATSWLMFETEHEGRRYCFFDGRWFELDASYRNRLARHVKEVFDRTPPLTLPEWRLADHPDEAAYNEFVASDVSGVKLDRELITTTQHRRGFEACDIVTRDGALVHVKHVPRSSAASHLIAQADVSTEALRFDDGARQALRSRLTVAGGDASWLPDRPTSVVLAMARDKPITAASLFSFTQVTLARLDRSLAEAGIELTVASVLRLESPG